MLSVVIAKNKTSNINMIKVQYMHRYIAVPMMKKKKRTGLRAATLDMLTTLPKAHFTIRLTYTM